MADVLVRLDVQSEAYESKLKNATANLQHMEKEVRRVGATFEVADKEDLEFIRSLGSMETHATNASGKIKEMTQSIAEMTMVYNRMSDAEKNAATGQALAASIAQQKGNLAEFKDALADASGEAQKTGGFIDTLADGLGQLGPVGQMAGKLLKGAFGPVGIAIAAVVGTIHQVVEAFKRNEDAMAGATRAAAPFKAIWQQIQRLFDRLVPYIASGMEKIANGMQSLFSKITDWMGKLANTSLGKKLGLDTVYEQLKKVSTAQAELTESNKKIADSENALNKMRRSTETGNTQRRAQIAELRFKASDKTNYSAEERVGFLENAQELEGKTLQANLALRQKEYELIKLKNSLTATGTADLDAENAALNAITDARTEYNEHLRSTQRQLEAARKEAEQEGGSGTSTDEETPKVKNAAAIWEEYQQKIAETTKRLEEFKAMMADTSLSDEQRDWAAGMADEYEKQLEKMKGATEEAVDEMTDKLKEIPSSFEMFKDGVGAVGSLVGAMDNLKNIGDDLAAAFSGELDAWDSLMTVLQSGIGIMETVISVIEAINTLTEIGAALKAKNAIAATTEASAVVAGKGTEAAATTSEMAVEATATGVTAGKAAASAGDAVAGIPIVGPVLAVAAVAAVLAAILASVSKAKSSAGSYAVGGIVPGSSFSGDNLTANVNSGELILNRAQQGAIAGQLQSNPMGNLRLSTEISGSNLRVVLNNDNRQRGGDRNFYSKIH